MHLLDAAKFHVDTATKISITENKPLASITHGDARELPYDDEQFDMVLLFGPLYHLQEKSDRVKSIAEAKRVLKKNGVLLAATISRHASLFDGYWQGFIDDPAFEEIWRMGIISIKRIIPCISPMRISISKRNGKKSSVRPAFRNSTQLLSKVSDGWFPIL
jgi:ubiquinone/menaquinone biosynthesis C-methylase UbiE